MEREPILRMSYKEREREKEEREKGSNKFFKNGTKRKKKESKNTNISQKVTNAK